ncbi:MAG: hypothetical protein HQK52_17845 [Oligoflexia bacterium]|nr:hypothetical protein [Oligoflexia bacterium]
MKTKIGENAKKQIIVPYEVFLKNIDTIYQDEHEGYRGCFFITLVTLKKLFGYENISFDFISKFKKDLSERGYALIEISIDQWVVLNFDEARNWRRLKSATISKIIKRKGLGKELRSISTSEKDDSEKQASNIIEDNLKKLLKINKEAADKFNEFHGDNASDIFTKLLLNGDSLSDIANHFEFTRAHASMQFKKIYNTDFKKFKKNRDYLKFKIPIDLT